MCMRPEGAAGQPTPAAVPSKGCPAICGAGNARHKFSCLPNLANSRMQVWHAHRLAWPICHVWLRHAYT